MLTTLKDQFKFYCQEMVAATPPTTVNPEDYLPTIRLFFRLISGEIKRIQQKHPDVENLTPTLKEVGWDTLEKYRDDFMSRDNPI